MTNYVETKLIIVHGTSFYCRWTDYNGNDEHAWKSNDADNLWCGTQRIGYIREREVGEGKRVYDVTNYISSDYIIDSPSRQEARDCLLMSFKKYLERFDFSV